MTDLILSARAVPPIDWTGVAPAVRTAYEGKVSAVIRSSQEAEDLAKWFGDATFCPLLPILLVYEDAQPDVIIGDGYADAAELRDLAVYQWERTTVLLEQNGGLRFDFDALRERHGLMRRDEVDAAVRNAMRDRVERHRRNPVTDKPRDPMRDSYPRQTFSRYTHGGTE